ncbi:phosphoribosylaminoimidazolesuccinocarboxamide synthase [Salinibacillus xinjiangensis]|uniref:Phosphoribosylaminoimidazole-succinocarboxamide synthase n=1 Tax=Salinibacillus xinjiangensis TaxID=1229268 RepID=A0A6G1XAL3_9BACI|nr:phosphoribosylaminoimidazolesuccinocarboxamide synthase [Salinibacillus xinjiangensis]MRG88051.1 phosphoribosylaminoimidazolesuccinocarboxamide synthase [Salinibacillus xinjiangensis]
MKKETLVYEGKAKRLYQTNQRHVLWVEYKDSATAFNAAKKATIDGKGRYNNEISSLLFQKLHENEVPNHFVTQISATEQLVAETTIIPIEVVVRNIVAGSLSKRIGKEEGTILPKAIIEFYYKDDELDDPLINEDHIDVLQLATPRQLEEIKQLAYKINDILIASFDQCEVKLVDFKLEFGLNHLGKLILADEISPDTCRLWDKATEQKLDKDVFRRDIGSLTDAYEEILTRLKGVHHV